MYANDSSFKEQLLEVISSNLSRMYDCYQRDHDKRNTTRNSASSAVEANSLSQTALWNSTRSTAVSGQPLSSQIYHRNGLAGSGQPSSSQTQSRPSGCV
ncbi:hypothetical protein QL285_003796 [Trifolium repens]|nr:hypothetical protein QL285_003796 [Trifolium repens]